MSHQLHFCVYIHEKENQDLKNNLYMYVFSSIIYNNQDMDMEALDVHL